MQVRQATIVSGDIAADMTSGAVMGLPVADDVSLSPRRERGGHPRFKVSRLRVYDALSPTAKLKTEKA